MLVLLLCCCFSRLVSCFAVELLVSAFACSLGVPGFLWFPCCSVASLVQCLFDLTSVDSSGWFYCYVVAFLGLFLFVAVSLVLAYVYGLTVPGFVSMLMHCWCWCNADLIYQLIPHSGSSRLVCFLILMFTFFEALPTMGACLFSSCS